MGIGLEPQHQRVVLLGGAAQCLIAEWKALVGSLHMQRQTARHGPGSANQCGVRTLGVVNGIAARTFVHWVVVNEAHFIAGEASVAVGGAQQAS